MIVEVIEEFAATLPQGRAVFGLDFGEKTIGVAASDLRRSVASPIFVIRRTKFTEDAKALLAMMADRNIAGLILGLPRNMDGSEGPRAQATRAFARNVEPLGLPILLWDERWSTQAVERAMVAADISRAKRAERVDNAAASWILQGAIDALMIGLNTEHHL